MPTFPIFPLSCVTATSKAMLRSRRSDGKNSTRILLAASLVASASRAPTSRELVDRPAHCAITNTIVLWSRKWPYR